jgi:hypothetical protein
MSECYHLSHFFKTVLIEIFKKGIHSDTRTSFILMNELQALTCSSGRVSLLFKYLYHRQKKHESLIYR